MGVMHVLDEKTGTDHVDHVVPAPNLDDLDTIEHTQTGKYSWLVSVTAGERQIYQVMNSC